MSKHVRNYTPIFKLGNQGKRITNLIIAFLSLLKPKKLRKIINHVRFFGVKETGREILINSLLILKEIGRGRTLTPLLDRIIFDPSHWETPEYVMEVDVDEVLPMIWKAWAREQS